MKSRDVITGIIVLVVIILGVIIFNRARNRSENPTPTATPTIAERISETFNGMPLPTGSNNRELKDVSGGSAFGVVTDTEVLADLPETSSGEFYQAWVDNNGTLTSLGQLRPAKGGYIISANLKDKKVVVSREKIFDNKVEVKILE